MVRLLKFQASLLHDLNIGVTSRLIGCSSLDLFLHCVSPCPFVFSDCRVYLFSCALDGQNIQIGFAWWGWILISFQEIRRIIRKRNLRIHFFHFSREFCFSNAFLFNHKPAGPLAFHHRGVCSQDYCPGIPSEEYCNGQQDEELLKQCNASAGLLPENLFCEAGWGWSIKCSANEQENWAGGSAGENFSSVGMS